LIFSSRSSADWAGLAAAARVRMPTKTLTLYRTFMGHLLQFIFWPVIDGQVPLFWINRINIDKTDQYRLTAVAIIDLLD
jgi:hypothetical protein